MPGVDVLVRLCLVLRGSIVIEEHISFNIVCVSYSFYFTLCTLVWDSSITGVKDFVSCQVGAGS